MTLWRYTVFFALILLIVGAAVTHGYWGPALLGPSNTAAANRGSSAEGMSLLNICVTVILFVLLAFSILNIYSFFNAQMDTERKDLRNAQEILSDAVRQQKETIGSLEDTQERDYLYQRNLVRLLAEPSPVHVRTAAAAYFLEHEPRDTDLEVLRSLLDSLPTTQRLVPLRSQLLGAVERWERPPEGGGRRKAGRRTNAT